MYEPYASSAYYKDIYMGTVLSDNTDKYLRQASRHIDTLTFNRIQALGFSKLSEFKQEIVSEVVCRLAEFECENEDVLNSVLQSYSINGVSMSFGDSWNIKIQSGIAIPMDTYELLKQTGLCCRVM